MSLDLDHWERLLDEGAMPDQRELLAEARRLNAEADTAVDMVIERYEDDVCPAMQARIDALEEENATLRRMRAELAELCTECFRRNVPEERYLWARPACFDCLPPCPELETIP